MTSKFSEKIADATRLTRKGRLADAVALIQQTIGRTSAHAGSRPSKAPSTHNPLSLLKIWPVPAASLVPPVPVCDAAEAQQHVVSRMGHYLDLLVAPAPAMDDSLHPVARKPAIKPRFEKRSFTAQAGTRSYKQFIPSSYRGQPVPLIVMLHGCSQSPVDFAAGTRMNEIAEEQGFIVAYPGQSSMANPGKCWNWYSANDQVRDTGEPSLIAGLTRQVMTEFNIDPLRVYVAGLSAGGAAAAVLGQAYPDIFAAIGVHSGLACGVASDMQSAMNAMRQGGTGPIKTSGRALPTIVFHGDRDSTVHHLNAAQVIEQSKSNGEFVLTSKKDEAAGGVLYTRTVHSDRSGQSILENWTLHGAGHAWSGGSAAGSYTDIKGPDASREMVRFFLQHTRS
ncbi:MAG: PHB depolymerase family esterase [Hyphomicrobiaceae bacterium]